MVTAETLRRGECIWWRWGQVATCPYYTFALGVEPILYGF